MLAILRYIIVCQNSLAWLHEYVTGKPTIRTVIGIFLSILIPAIIFASSMFFGIPATGKKWNFMLKSNNFNSSDSNVVIAFQNIDQSKRGTGIIVVIITCSLLAIQNFLTLYVYAKICYTSLVSTINVALKRENQESPDAHVPETKSNEEKSKQVQKQHSKDKISKVFLKKNVDNHELFVQEIEYDYLAIQKGRMGEPKLTRKLDNNKSDQNIESQVELEKLDIVQEEPVPFEDAPKTNKSCPTHTTVYSTEILEAKRSSQMRNADTNPDAIFTISRERCISNDSDTAQSIDRQVSMKSIKVQNKSSKCKADTLPTKTSRNEKKRRLLTMLLGEECKEFITSKNFDLFMCSTWQEEKDAYHEVHKDAVSRNKMKPIFKYISNRLSQKVNFANLTRIVNQRHRVYEKIFLL